MGAGRLGAGTEVVGAQCSRAHVCLPKNFAKIRLPSFVKELNNATANCNNALPMLQPDIRTAGP